MKRTSELESKGMNPQVFDIDREWLTHWNKRLKELCLEELSHKRDDLMRQFNVTESDLLFTSNDMNNQNFPVNNNNMNNTGYFPKGKKQNRWEKKEEPPKQSILSLLKTIQLVEDLLANHKITLSALIKKVSTIDKEIDVFRDYYNELSIDAMKKQLVSQQLGLNNQMVKTRTEAAVKAAINIEQMIISFKNSPEYHNPSKGRSDDRSKVPGSAATSTPEQQVFNAKWWSEAENSVQSNDDSLTFGDLFKKKAEQEMKNQMANVEKPQFNNPYGQQFNNQSYNSQNTVVNSQQNQFNQNPDRQFNQPPRNQFNQQGQNYNNPPNQQFNQHAEQKYNTSGSGYNPQHSNSSNMPYGNSNSYTQEYNTSKHSQKYNTYGNDYSTSSTEAYNPKAPGMGINKQQYNSTNSTNYGENSNSSWKPTTESSWSNKQYQSSSGYETYKSGYETAQSSQGYSSKSDDYGSNLDDWETQGYNTQSSQPVDHFGLDVQSIARATYNMPAMQVVQYVAKQFEYIGKKHPTEDMLHKILTAVSSINKAASSSSQNQSHDSGSVYKLQESLKIGARSINSLYVEELKTLLANFKNLDREQQKQLTTYLKDLESINPEKLQQLRALMSKK